MALRIVLRRWPDRVIAMRIEPWIDDQLRTKYRAEVEEGDSIWLDTEKDILISFYQRLRSGIDRVWNYPGKSKERGETGSGSPGRTRGPAHTE